MISHVPLFVYLIASEIATLSFDQLQHSCQENDGVIRISVLLQPQQPVDCMVVYRLISYTACKHQIMYYRIFYCSCYIHFLLKGVGTDVMGSESLQSVVIAAGETRVNISIKILDDVDEEEDEMILVILVGSNCIREPPSESITTIEIIDDDEGSHIWVYS